MFFWWFRDYFLIFSLPGMIRERLLHASSMECTCEKYQKTLVFLGKMRFRGKRDADEFLVQWISNPSRWICSVIVWCISVSFRRSTHRVFMTGAFSEKSLWGLMFPHGYECFRVFSESDDGTVFFFMIFDVFLITFWWCSHCLWWSEDDVCMHRLWSVHVRNLKKTSFPGKMSFFSNAVMEKWWTVDAKVVDETSQGVRKSWKRNQKTWTTSK